MALWQVRWVVESLYAGEAKVEQAAQGVRFKGKFDSNLILFFGGLVSYT
jgi:hypothetical protein